MPKGMFIPDSSMTRFLTHNLILAAGISLILTGGLVGILFYSNSVAGIDTPPDRVIVGDTPEFMKFEGLAPTMEPWENGLRTNPMPGTFDWWYLQGTFSDGSHAEFTFFTKPWLDNTGPLQPYIGVTITSPNGTVYHDVIRVSTDQFAAARNTLNLTMGDNYLRGNLKVIVLHVESAKGFGADLVFNSILPPSRFGGAGIWYFDPSLTRFSALMDPMPYAAVHGSLTYDGKTHQVQGDGYHDRQWGTINWNQVLDRWFWTTGHFGNYTIDTGAQVTSAFYDHQQLQNLYLARGNQVLVDTMRGVTIQGTGNVTTPSGHDYPEILKMHWQNGSDTVDLSLTNPKVIQAASPVFNTNATIYGNPEYFRLGGNATLSVNIGGVNETESGPAVWEVNYAH